MERVFKEDKDLMNDVSQFLLRQGLRLSKDIEELYVLRKNDIIIASGGLSNNVLKCIAVDESHKGTGVINEVMTHLINRCHHLNRHNLFIYTKPSSYESFEYFGFKKIAESENVVLMENSPIGLNNYLESLKPVVNKRNIASVVVNCNPFTYGHHHLIKQAASLCDWVHVFVVMEDKSTFPSHVRMALVQAGTKDIKNISIHEGRDYIISSATFPSYFLEEDKDLVKEHAKLDLQLFGKEIAKYLGIAKRFIGHEPFNKTTALYNQVMKDHLPTLGVEVVEIPRLKKQGIAISASSVRQALFNKDLETIAALVPPSTYAYLISDGARQVIEKIETSYLETELV